MTALDGSVPRNMTCTNAETYYEGYLYKVTTNALTSTTDKGDTAVAVCDVASVNEEGTALAAVTGEKKGFFIIGSGAIVMMASITGVTYAVGAIVYADDTNGMCSITATTSRPVGHYVGDGVTTTASGELIEVCLDVQIGAATV